MERYLLWGIPIIGGLLILRQVAKANAATPQAERIVRQNSQIHASAGTVQIGIVALPAGGYTWRATWATGEARGPADMVFSTPDDAFADAEMRLSWQLGPWRQGA